MTRMIFEPLKQAAIAADPDAEALTSIVALWVTPTDKALGFIRCVAPEDAKALAQMLREHADAIDPPAPAEADPRQPMFDRMMEAMREFG
jgi:hypothetical protein